MSWEAWAPYLEDALRRSGGTHGIEDVEREILEGRAEFWDGDRAACVTVVLDYPQKRVLRVWLAAGEMDAIERAVAVGEHIARDLGCDAVEVEGRKGWERILRDHGYRADRVVLTKEVR